MIAVVIIVCFVVVYFLLRDWKTPENIYLDTGKNSQVFKSEIHCIAAKPDRIIQGKGEVIPREFKSRTTGVARHDIVQVKTATIAIRESGYRVNRAVIELGSGKEQTIKIEPTSELLNGRVGELIEIVRDIKRGREPKPTTEAHKCKRCPYRASCPHAMA